MNGICLLPKLEGLGGPASFRFKLSAGLQARGLSVLTDPRDPDCRVLLLIGGTRHLEILQQARRRGVRIIQRLDGLNWVHRQRRTGLRHYLRSELNNLLLAWIRDHSADGVVYQSEFIRGWWHREHGPAQAEEYVIYNAVDLEQYAPSEADMRPVDFIRILVVEGHLRDGLEVGLDNAVRVAEGIQTALRKPVELMVAGDVAESARMRWNKEAQVRLNWVGIVPRDRIPDLDRSAHLLYSAELNAPCPNSVIEALACGLPVLAFATGALPELVPPSAGRIVPYGGDPWKLSKPDLPALSAAGAEMLANLDAYREGARKQAESRFGLDRMVQKYIDVLLPEGL